MPQSMYGLILCSIIAIISPYLKPYTGFGAALIALLLGAFLNPLYERKNELLSVGVGKVLKLYAFLFEFLLLLLQLLS